MCFVRSITTFGGAYAPEKSGYISLFGQSGLPLRDNMTPP